MTEAELWHMHLLAVENTSSGLEGVMTIIFAFLATAYFVGGRLTRVQAAMLSIFFVVGAGTASMMAMVEFRRSVFFMDKLTQQFGVVSMSPNSVVVPLMAIVLGLFIPASVVFLYQMRRKEHPSEEPSE